MRTDEELLAVDLAGATKDLREQRDGYHSHSHFGRLGRRAVYDLGRAEERKENQAVIDGLRVALAEAEEACLEAQNERDRLADKYEPVEIPRKFA